MTVDLRTGLRKKHDPLDYITKIAAVAPAAPGTPAQLWFAFLEKVTDGNDELIGFLQRFVGYCMTGHVHEQVLAFLWGTGGNGKGVFANTITGIMNDYALVAPMDMFMESKNDRHPTEIARLKGVRLVVAFETQSGRAWDEKKIKSLTGGDKLTGRFMRGDFFDFMPTHKLMILGNHKPSLRNVDEAIRRRFLVVPFTVTTPSCQRSSDLNGPRSCGG
jgi:putative DNA primase/helicase